MVSFTLIRTPPQPPVLEDDLVRLRAAQLTDYSAWAHLRTISRAHLTRWEPDWADRDTAIDSFRVRLRLQERLHRAGTALSLLAFRKNGGDLVGGVTLSDIRLYASRSAVIGYWIGEPFLRKGYGGAAVRLVLGHAFGALGLNRIEAACQPGNLPSKALLAKTGFLDEGLARDYLYINGEWRDHQLYAVTARDYCGAPPEIAETGLF